MLHINMTAIAARFAECRNLATAESIDAFVDTLGREPEDRDQFHNSTERCIHTYWQGQWIASMRDNSHAN